MEDVFDFEIESIKIAALNAGEASNRVSVVLTEKQIMQIKNRSDQLRHESSKIQISNDNNKKKKQIDQCWDWKNKNQKR